MKSLIELWRELAIELASACYTSATRDVETVSGRCDKEGFSFLTITLPTFGKDLERSLAVGRVCDEAWTGFNKSASGLPRFLGGFLRNIFTPDGAVGPVTDLQVQSISAVRQLCSVFAKIEVPCTNARNLSALDGFKQADAETGMWDQSEKGEELANLRRIYELLFREVLVKMDHRCYYGDLIPRHGPGAVAERTRGNAKFDFVNWPSRLDDVFPYREYGIPALRYHYLADHVQFPAQHEERPSRIILVPKTMKTPRVIAAESTALQYMQQALLRELVPLLEGDSLVGQMIGFTDQEPNRRMAREGSITGSLATLDLSEASDRVSYRQVVNSVERIAPHFASAIKATRGQLAELPSGEIISIQKFASMGSALCFPMEAMTFLAGVFLGIEKYLLSTGQLRSHLTRADVRRLSGKVRVYGDDIIIPVECVDAVIEQFSAFGWKVNSNKSFWTGLFRESCGGDFYAGQEVTPVKLTKPLPNSTRDVLHFKSFVEFRNRLYKAGLWRSAAWCDRRIRKQTRYYPIVHETSAVIGRFSFLPFVGEKEDKELHRPLVRGLVLVPRIPVSVSSDTGALLKCLLASYDEPDHLERAGRPSVVDIKLRWSTPY